ncbi:uncharacterized protein LOC134696568 [Mytilus trossulus]|uniref:uncharacterized protein LOC134696568 n=1 Tax=Mytilus trossulus TaxID=6551 RepID=UPI0030073686
MNYHLHFLMSIYFGLLHTIVESGDTKMNMVLRALMSPTPLPTTMPPTPSPTTMRPLPSMPMIPQPPRCVYRGQTYRFGEMIQQGQSGNWCHFTMCDLSGQIIHGDDFHCSTTTLLPTTNLPRTTTPRGCFFEGRHYQLGEQISSGQSGNWCHFSMCDYSGQIHGDVFNCLATLRPTTPT